MRNSRSVLNGFWHIILIVLLFFLSFKVFPAWFPFFRKEWILVGLLSFVVFILYSRRIINDKLFIFWGIYSIIVLFKTFIGRSIFSDIQSALFECSVLFVAAWLPLCILFNNEQRFIKQVLFGTFIILLFECVSSFILLNQFPSAIRTMHVIMQEESESEGYRLYGAGLIDYAFCHALPIMIPPLFYLYKKNTNWRTKILLIISIVICSLLVWMSESTTAFLMLVLMIILGILTKSNQNKWGVLIVILVFLPFMMSESLQIGFLDVIGSIVGPDSEYSAKISEIQYTIIQDTSTGDLEGRINHYAMSLDVFLKNPIFGGNGEVGRHSAILDRLATLGIIGFLPLFIFFLSYFKKIKETIPINARRFYYEAFFAGIMMFVVKGMWFWPMFYILFIVMPMMFLCKLDK